MANLTVVATDVSPVRVWEQVTLPAVEAIDAGETVRLVTASGKATLANASSAAEGRLLGVAINSAVAGQAVTVVKRGLVDLGDALTSETYDELILLSDTDGKMDDGAGSPTASYAVGRVFPSFGATTADKILFVDVETGADPAIANLAGNEFANVANGNTEGGALVVFAIALAGGSTADYDTTIDNKIRVIDFWVQNDGLGTASDTAQLKSTAAAITDALDMSGADEVVVRAGTINNANATVIAGGILRVAQVDGGGSDVISEDGMVSNEAEYQAEIKRSKEEVI